MLMMNLYLLVPFIFCLTIGSSAKECTVQGEDDLYNLQDGCTKIKGDVILTPQLPSNINLEWLEQKLSSVTKITGFLEISHTNFTEIKFLRNLETVEILGDIGKEKVPHGVVTIAGNQATTIDLSKLTAININTTSSELIMPLIMMANKFCLEEATAIRLAQLSALIADTQICNPSKVHCMMSMKSEGMPMFISQNLPDGCQILYGCIYLYGDATNTINSKLSTIELLTGPVYIHGNSMTTLNFTSLTHIVNALGIYFPSLGVVQNEKLKSLLVPNLKSVKSTSPTWKPSTGEQGQMPTMVIAMNPSLPLDAQTCGILSSIAKVNKLEFMAQQNAQNCSGSESGPDLSGVQEYTVPSPGSGGGKVVLVEMTEPSGSNGDHSSEPGNNSSEPGNNSSEPGDHSSEPGFIKPLSTLTPLSLSILLAYLFF